MVARDLISSEIPILKSSDTVDRALQLMADYKSHFLPIVDNNDYVGFISEDILLNCDFDTLIEDIEPLNYFKSVDINFPLVEVIKVFKEPEIQFVPVFSQSVFEGIVLRQDAFEALVNKMVLSDHGGLLEITLTDQNYSLTEISRIIEQESGKIISLFLSHDANQNLVLSIKLDVAQISTIINALNRYDYDVSSYFSSEPVTNLEKDRYDLLMKYLSI
jgi:predicted transcriptional regulator